MCGIFFIFNKSNEISEQRLKNTVAKISHRGPDNQGVYSKNKVGMGHARLSIIDLSDNANQPFESIDQNYKIIFNGEIYNFLEIKTELLKNGIKFRTSSDTEVLLNSFIYWGEKCIKKLNGMFAFVIYDIKKNEVFVGRDRFGVKPLYYLNKYNKIIFSSEIKAIIDYIPRVEINKQSIHDYFVFQNLLNNKTFFNDVHIFPHGCFSKFKLEKNNSIQIKKYWDFNFSNDNLSLNEIENINHLLRRSVKKNLLADVSLAFYLSSGLDSTLINVIANDYNEKLNTYSCGFKVDSNKLRSFDESKAAQATAKLLNSNHNTLMVNSNDNIKYIDKLVYHLEDLKLGQSYPNYLIAKEVSKKHKIVLSGAGGDELFAGYIWRYESIFQNNKNSFLKNYFLKCQRVLNVNSLPSIFLNYSNSETKRLKESFYSYFENGDYNDSEQDYLNQIQNYECKTFLQGYLNVEDKLSMANGLETRVPFLENELFEYSMKLNHNQKLQIRNKSIIEGKLIIRKLLKDKYPFVTSYKKQGFAAPDFDWYKKQIKNNELNTLIDLKLSHEFINIKSLKSKIIHFKTKEPHRFKAIIWNMLNFEKLLQTYF